MQDKKEKAKRARAPDGLVLYAVGDIHGRCDLLERLVKRIEADAAANPVKKKEMIFLGDYVDRGVNAKGVIDFLLNELPSGMAKTFLRGNHDEYMLKFLKGDLEQAQDWLALGGTATLVSYGVNPFRANVAKDMPALREAFAGALPKRHREFLASTVLNATRGDYYFVHAGVRPGVSLDKQTREDRLWIRYEFLGSKKGHGKMVVHGHSILPEPDIQPNRIGIDTGAYATGTLTCLVLEGTSRKFLST